MEKAVKITLAITIPLVFIVGFLCFTWIFSPTEFTIIFKVENETLNTMNNLTKAIEQGPSDIVNRTKLIGEVLG